MKLIATREDGGLWSAASAAKLYCFRLPLAEAIESVVSQTNLTHEQAAGQFVSMSLPDFYSVWSSAVHHSIQFQEMLASENEVLGADVSAAKAEIESLKAKMAKHEHDYGRLALQTAIKEAERTVNDEFAWRLELSLKSVKDGAPIRNALWKWIAENSENYAELIRLREKMNEDYTQG